jgi:hypothetical protein
VAKVRRLEADSTSSLVAARGAARELYEETLGQFEKELEGQNKREFPASVRAAK